MAWLPPTGFVDPANYWTDETDTYDGDTGTAGYGIANVDYFGGWSNEFELTRPGISCDKVRYYIDAATHGDIDEIYIKVEYDSAWHDVYQGAFTEGEWIEKSIPAGIKTVTAAIFKLHCTTSNWRRLYLAEFEFWQAAVLHELVVTDGLELTDTLIKNPIVAFSDGIALTDTLVKNPIKTLVDAIAFTDAWEGYKLIAKVVTDGIAFTDTLVKSTAKVVTDGIAFTDAVVKHLERVLADGIAFSDALVKSTTKVLADGIAFSDIIVKSTIKVFSDSIVIGEALVKWWTQHYERTFTDAIKFKDCLTRWRWLAAIRNLVRPRCPKPSVREQDKIDDGNVG